MGKSNVSAVMSHGILRFSLLFLIIFLGNGLAVGDSGTNLFLIDNIQRVYNETNMRQDIRSILVGGNKILDFYYYNDSREGQKKRENMIKVLQSMEQENYNIDQKEIRNSDLRREHQKPLLKIKDQIVLASLVIKKDILI